jgi:uncharacterized membrane protein
MNNVNFIQTYFTEERIESLIFIIIGSIAITLALIFLSIIKYSFFKGLAYPLLFIGIIQIVVGFNVYNRSSTDISRVEHIFNTNKYQLQVNEIPRIEAVLTNFMIFKWIEIILIITSIFLITRFYKSPQTFWKGLGLGLLIQAGIMLCLDIIAEHRAEIYLQFLLKA